ncbi:hypothetical protein QCA50_013101 [Cerrena zonata]|uniref:Uncharacterized protein n=1 Tax=Cerrena zonata TaxID=2478898 RepID=A0AAW0G3T8_9APHY
METPEEAEEVADGVDSCNKVGVVQGLKQAEAEKALGNQDLKRKQRTDAIKHYSEAVECLHDAWSQKPTDNQTKEIKNLMSVCLANRAAAWLMEGEGQDAKKALKDAEEAIEREPSYNKAYYRAAKAHQLLSENTRAIQIIVSGLTRKDLENNSGLIDGLIEIYGGIPDTENELRDFCTKVFKNPTTGNEVKKLAGFCTRVSKKIHTVIGPDETIDSI